MDKLIKQLKADEGYRKFPYLCLAGKLTIGYGRNLEANGVSEEEAETLLRNDIEAARKAVNSVLTVSDLFSPARYRVLVMMAFHLGEYGLRGFKNMLTAIRQERWDEAARHLLDSEAARQSLKRYERFARMMREG